MITFGSDVADLILQRTLGENTLGLNNTINRMTTGYKVNHAKDNAAGYSIITDLSKKISSMQYHPLYSAEPEALSLFSSINR